MSYLEQISDWELERELTQKTIMLEKEKTIQKMLKEEGLFLGWNKEHSIYREKWLEEQKGKIRAEIARRNQNRNCFT